MLFERVSSRILPASAYHFLLKIIDLITEAIEIHKALLTV